MKTNTALGLRFALGALLASNPVHANGRFPAANQLEVDPSDSSHLVLGVTFGILESRDGGKSFSWTCERVLGLADREDPVIVLSDVGTTVLATFAGVATSQDGCAYRYDPGLAGEIVPDLTRSAGVSGQLYGFRTMGLPEGRFDSQLIRSEDGGESWERLAPALPDDLLPLTLEVSASDPERLYVSGRLGRSDGYRSVLLSSRDAGESFERFDIPDTEDQRLAFISAVDPNDADRVYVRVDEPQTRLLVSEDGGATFRTLFTGNGRLLGFALSPDGDTLAVGGPDDGIWVSGATTLELERRSDIAPSCLRFTEGALYACATELESGFVLGRSTDLAQSFEPVLRFESLCGPTACSPETQVGGDCRAEWPLLAQQLGASCGVEGVAGTGGGGNADSPAAPRDDGGCSLSASSWRASWVFGAFALAFGVFGLRRLRPRV